MKTVELFSGTQSFSKVARVLGHETYCVDNNGEFDNDLTTDLSTHIPSKVWEKIEKADIVWMSPPCTTFSMASGNTHWNADRSPKTEEAIKAREMLKICWEVAEYCFKNRKLFFIENPRARARWFLPKEWRKTAWYCRYGDKRAKPTDIWTNMTWWNPKTCKNGNLDCHHERAPRGSRTGTQGLKGNKERSVIPRELFIEIFAMLGGSA